MVADKGIGRCAMASFLYGVGLYAVAILLVLAGGPQWPPTPSKAFMPAEYPASHRYSPGWRLRHLCSCMARPSHAAISP